MAIVRPARVAGLFYPADARSCRLKAAEYLSGVESPAALGAIVPHAGWDYSGSTAALGWHAVAAGQPDTVVIFGAVHSPDMNVASVFPEGAWQTPLGNIEIDRELAARFASGELLEPDADAHRAEHSIEVQLPLLRCLLPEARFVPISVQPGPDAPEVGRFCAAEARDVGRAVAFVGTTDLTHYGPNYAFEPHGHGPAGVQWAKEVNDRRFVRLIEAMDAEGVISEAAENRNACGAGAVAATIAAMHTLGATRYEELRHTTSAEVTAENEPSLSTSVGYEAGIFLA